MTRLSCMRPSAAAAALLALAALATSGFTQPASADGDHAPGQVGYVSALQSLAAAVDTAAVQTAATPVQRITTWQWYPRDQFPSSFDAQQDPNEPSNSEAKGMRMDSVQERLREGIDATTAFFGTSAVPHAVLGSLSDATASLPLCALKSQPEFRECTRISSCDACFSSEFECGAFYPDTSLCVPEVMTGRRAQPHKCLDRETNQAVFLNVTGPAFSSIRDCPGCLDFFLAGRAAEPCEVNPANCILAEEVAHGFLVVVLSLFVVCMMARSREARTLLGQCAKGLAEPKAVTAELKARGIIDLEKKGEELVEWGTALVGMSKAAGADPSAAAAGAAEGAGSHAASNSAGAAASSASASVSTPVLQLDTSYVLLRFETFRDFTQLTALWITTLPMPRPFVDLFGQIVLWLNVVGALVMRFDLNLPDFLGLPGPSVVFWATLLVPTGVLIYVLVVVFKNRLALGRLQAKQRSVLKYSVILLQTVYVPVWTTILQGFTCHPRVACSLCDTGVFFTSAGTAFLGVALTTVFVLGVPLLTFFAVSVSTRYAPFNTAWSKEEHLVHHEYWLMEGDDSPFNHVYRGLEPTGLYFKGWLLMYKALVVLFSVALSFASPTWAYVLDAALLLAFTTAISRWRPFLDPKIDAASTLSYLSMLITLLLGSIAVMTAALDELALAMNLVGILVALYLAVQFLIGVVIKFRGRKSATFPAPQDISADLKQSLVLTGGESAERATHTMALTSKLRGARGDAASGVAAVAPAASAAPADSGTGEEKQGDGPGDGSGDSGGGGAAGDGDDDGKAAPLSPELRELQGATRYGDAFDNAFMAPVYQLAWLNLWSSELEKAGTQLQEAVNAAEEATAKAQGRPRVPKIPPAVQGVLGAAVSAITDKALLLLKGEDPATAGTVAGDDAGEGVAGAIDPSTVDLADDIDSDGEVAAEGLVLDDHATDAAAERNAAAAAGTANLEAGDASMAEKLALAAPLEEVQAEGNKDPAVQLARLRVHWLQQVVKSLRLDTYAAVTRLLYLHEQTVRCVTASGEPSMGAGVIRLVSLSPLRVSWTLVERGAAAASADAGAAGAATLAAEARLMRSARPSARRQIIAPLHNICVPGATADIPLQLVSNPGGYSKWDCRVCLRSFPRNREGYLCSSCGYRVCVRCARELELGLVFVSQVLHPKQHYVRLTLRRPTIEERLRRFNSVVEDDAASTSSSDAQHRKFRGRHHVGHGHVLDTCTGCQALPPIVRADEYVDEDRDRYVQLVSVVEDQILAAAAKRAVRLQITHQDVPAAVNPVLHGDVGLGEHKLDQRRRLLAADHTKHIAAAMLAQARYGTQQFVGFLGAPEFSDEWVNPGRGNRSGVRRTMRPPIGVGAGALPRQANGAEATFDEIRDAPVSLEQVAEALMKQQYRVECLHCSDHWCMNCLERVDEAYLATHEDALIRHLDDTAENRLRQMRAEALQRPQADIYGSNDWIVAQYGWLYHTKDRDRRVWFHHPDEGFYGSVELRRRIPTGLAGKVTAKKLWPDLGLVTKLQRQRELLPQNHTYEAEATLDRKISKLLKRAKKGASGGDFYVPDPRGEGPVLDVLDMLTELRGPRNQQAYRYGESDELERMKGEALHQLIIRLDTRGEFLELLPPPEPTEAEAGVASGTGAAAAAKAPAPTPPFAAALGVSPYRAQGREEKATEEEEEEEEEEEPEPEPAPEPTPAPDGMRRVRLWTPTWDIFKLYVVRSTVSGEASRYQWRKFDNAAVVPRDVTARVHQVQTGSRRRPQVLAHAFCRLYSSHVGGAERAFAVRYTPPMFVTDDDDTDDFRRRHTDSSEFSIDGAGGVGWLSATLALDENVRVYEKRVKEVQDDMGERGKFEGLCDAMFREQLGGRDLARPVDLRFAKELVRAERVKAAVAAGGGVGAAKSKVVTKGDARQFLTQRQLDFLRWLWVEAPNSSDGVGAALRTVLPALSKMRATPDSTLWYLAVASFWQQNRGIKGIAGDEHCHIARHLNPAMTESSIAWTVPPFDTSKKPKEWITLVPPSAAQSVPRAASGAGAAAASSAAPFAAAGAAAAAMARVPFDEAKTLVALDPIVSRLHKDWVAAVSAVAAASNASYVAYKGT